MLTNISTNEDVTLNKIIQDLKKLTKEINKMCKLNDKKSKKAIKVLKINN